MTMNLTISVEGGEDLARKLSARNTKLGPQVAVTANPILSYVGRIGHAAARYAKDEAPDDTGKLIRGIKFRFAGRRGNVVSAAKHTKFVVDGRRPGTMPPSNALLGWVGRHGMPASAAFPVARAIAERGIEPNDFLGRAFVKMLREDVPKAKRQFVSDTERQWSS